MERSAFAGGDQEYLRGQQYKDTSNLDARTQLHVRYGDAELSFPDFAASRFDWSGIVDVLECGTGAGRFWDNAITQRTARLTLTDLSPGMVDAAVERARSRGFDAVAGETCDVQALPYEDASFDVAIANHMLYHVPAPDLALGELARVLRSGGRLVASTNGYGHMQLTIDALQEVFGPHHEGLYEVFGIESGEARLREHFSEITWHAYRNDLWVDDPDAVLAYCLSFPPGEDGDAEQRAALRAAIERRFVDGRLRIPTRTGVFICRR